MGGAGCNVAEVARARGKLPRDVFIATVNAPEAGRAVDVHLRSSRHASPDRRGLERVAVDMRAYSQVVLIAGLCGRTGFALLVDFAEAARMARVRALAVVLAPFSFEGPPSCDVASIEPIADRVTLVDNARMQADLPSSTLWSDCLRYTNDRAAEVVEREVLGHVSI